MTDRWRFVVLVTAALLVFGATAAILMRVIPGPHREIDYMAIGAISTLASLLALFVMLTTGVKRAPDVFFKRRKGS